MGRFAVILDDKTLDALVVSLIKETNEWKKESFNLPAQCLALIVKSSGAKMQRQSIVDHVAKACTPLMKMVLEKEDECD
jgi:hypothetical protein